METLTEAVERLEQRGFRESFRAEEDALRAVGLDRCFRPEDLVVEEQVRFEGTSDPADETILFALRSADGAVRGLFVAHFGLGVEPRAAEIVRRLPQGPPAGSAAPRGD